jgi:hypothetical protein
MLKHLAYHAFAGRYIPGYSNYILARPTAQDETSKLETKIIILLREKQHPYGML